MIKTMQDRQPGLGTTGIVGTLTLTKTGTTARTVTFPDAAITVAGSASALTSGRVPYVTTGGLLTDTAKLLYTNDTITLGDGTGQPLLALCGAAGTARYITGYTGAPTNATRRWLLYIAGSTAESGADAGSEFALLARTDAGAAIDTPLSIVRAAGGAITLARPVTCTGTLTVPNGTAAAPGIRTTTYAHGLYSIGATSAGVSIAGTLALTVAVGGEMTLAATSTASTTAGALQREANQSKLYTFDNGIGGWVDKCIFSQYAAVTQSGVVTAQSLASATARGTRTLPANFFKVGKVIKFRLCGIYTTDVAAGNATLAINIGGTTIRTTGSFALDASITSGYWTLDGEFTCYSTGGSGTISGQTVWLHRQAGAGGQPAHMQEMTTTGTVTLDTTASGAFDVVWTADDAGTAITCTCFRLWEVC